MEKEQIMKKFRQMNKTLQCFLVFLLLAVLTAVSFLALDYHKLKANGCLKDFDMDDFSVEFYDEDSTFHIGKGGIVLNGRGISSVSPVKKYDFSYDFDGIRHLTLGGADVEITILQSDENRINITSDAREIREERVGGRLTLDAGKKHAISFRVECKNPEMLDLVVKGAEVELDSYAELKSLEMDAVDAEVRSDTENSYPMNVRGVSVDGMITVKKNDYAVVLDGTEVEWNGTNVVRGGKAFSETFGTGKDALEISGTVIDLVLDD